MFSLTSNSNTYTGQFTDDFVRSITGDHLASAKNLAHADVPGSNDGEGGSHFKHGPAMPSHSLKQHSLRTNREMLKQMFATVQLKVTSVCLHGAENHENFEKLQQENPELQCLDVTQLFMEALNTPPSMSQSVGTQFQVLFVKSDTCSILVFQVPSQCWGKMLQTQGHGGGRQDLAVRVSYFLVAQCVRLMRGDSTCIENFEESSLYVNRISNSARVGSTFDASYAGRGGFARVLWDMSKGHAITRTFDLKDMRWIIGYLRQWCGTDLRKTKVAIGLRDLVVTTENNHLHAVDHPTREKVLQDVEYLAKVYLLLDQFESRLAAGKMLRHEEHLKSQISNSLVRIGAARYEKLLCRKSMDGQATQVTYDAAIQKLKEDGVDASVLTSFTLNQCLSAHGYK